MVPAAQPSKDVRKNTESNSWVVPLVNRVQCLTTGVRVGVGVGVPVGLGVRVELGDCVGDNVGLIVCDGEGLTLGTGTDFTP